ncbi:hypothetical protein CC79DRAFT_1358258 [Sarocladium strictum]
MSSGVGRQSNDEAQPPLVAEERVGAELDHSISVSDTDRSTYRNSPQQAPTEPLVDVKAGATVFSLQRNDPDDNLNATTPQPVPYSHLTISVLAADGASVILPLALLGFLIALINLHGHEASDVSLPIWSNAITVLATAFPIIFAAIVGRLTYELARWKLEKGSTLGSLEQLLGSRTFGNTVLTQCSLRSLNALSLCLILLWSFSPLGAQSILRIFESRYEPNVTMSTIDYLDTEKPQRLSMIPFERDQETWDEKFLLKLNVRFTAFLLLSPTAQKNHLDLWANIRVPFLEEEVSRVQVDNQGWQLEPASYDRDDFTSLTGIRLTDLGPGNASFTFESSYLDLECDSITTTTVYGIEEGLIATGWPLDDIISSKIPGHIFKNGSWHGVSTILNDSSSPKVWTIAADRFVDPYWQGVDRSKPQSDRGSPAIFCNETGIGVGRTRLLFQTRTLGNLSEPSDLGLRSIFSCQARQQYVESYVQCLQPLGGENANMRDCSILKQRKSRKTHASEHITHFSFPQTFEHITKNLPRTTEVAKSPTSDLFNVYSSRADVPSYHRMTWDNKQKRLVSRRLSQLLNTYLTLSSYDDYVFGYDETGLWQTTRTSVELSTLMRRFHSSTRWSIIGVVSCIVCLASGVASVVIAHIAKSPEVLGYASTVLRDSKIVNLYPSVGHMAAMDISKVHKSLRLRYGYDETIAGSRVIGVGLEKEVTPIQRRAS